MMFHMHVDHRKSKLLRYFKKHHRMPSYRELAELVGLRSVSSAHDLTELWIRDGFVTKDETGRIIPGEIQWFLPLLGDVAAGVLPEDQQYGKSAVLDDWLLEQEKPTYMIRVNGNSMKDAAILDGDHVVVERNSDCKPGDIVIARVDGCWTIKHLRKEDGGRVFLQAADDRYSCIYPSHELKVVAKVTAVIRRYSS
jgi:SOS-response transcriptional repressor LexA